MDTRVEYHFEEKLKNKNYLEIYRLTLLIQEEADEYFRPCSVNPGRKDAFVFHHNSDQIQRFSNLNIFTCLYLLEGKEKRMTGTRIENY